MFDLTANDLHTAFNWACAKVSACRSPIIRELESQTANKVHSAYTKAADGKVEEITHDEISCVASVALDVEMKAGRDTVRYELAKSIFQKAANIRKTLEPVRC